MPLTTQIDLSVIAHLIGVADLGNPRADLSYAAAVALATGIGAGQADLIFHDQRTLAASATEDLDLAGILVSPLGAVLTFARIKAVIIKAATGNANNVNVTRPATNGVVLFIAAGDGLAVRPGGIFVFACSDATGVVVTASTGDLLTITNSAGGTSVVYDIIIVGCSA
jgi:hypothetical protein